MLCRIVDEYRGLSQWIADTIEDPHIVRSLLSSIRHTNTRFVSSILCTVKMHKPDGEVGLRILHSSVKHMFVPGMKLISHFLKPAIKTVPCLVRDSDDLIRRMKEIKVPCSAFMMKYDIEDFLYEWTS